MFCFVVVCLFLFCFVCLFLYRPKESSVQNKMVGLLYCSNSLLLCCTQRPHGLLGTGSPGRLFHSGIRTIRDGEPRKDVPLWDKDY